MTGRGCDKMDDGTSGARCPAIARVSGEVRRGCFAAVVTTRTRVNQSLEGVETALCLANGLGGVVLTITTLRR